MPIRSIDVIVHMNVFLQVEEDNSLVPQSSDAGYQFDPNSTIPHEGFKFWAYEGVASLGGASIRWTTETLPTDRLAFTFHVNK